jgi:hypothetical protein
MAAMTEIQKLHLRWHKKTGEDMPANIACLPIEKIRKAVDWTEQGITVVVPRRYVAVQMVEESSIMAWDQHGEGS